MACTFSFALGSSMHKDLELPKLSQFFHLEMHENLGNSIKVSRDAYGSLKPH
jgi:hypothetical protein